MFTGAYKMYESGFSGVLHEMMEEASDLSFMGSVTVAFRHKVL